MSDLIRFKVGVRAAIALISAWLVMMLALTAYQWATDRAKLECRMKCTRPTAECKELCE